MAWRRKKGKAADSPQPAASSRNPLEGQLLSDIGPKDVTVCWEDAMKGVALAPDLSAVESAFSTACADASRMVPNLDFQDDRAAEISSLLISRPFYEAYCKSLLSIREQRHDKLSACERVKGSQESLRELYEKQLGIIRNPYRAVSPTADTATDCETEDANTLGILPNSYATANAKEGEQK